MYRQIFDPVGGSLALSALVALLPLLTIFLLLGVLKMKAQWASLIALAVSLAVAIFAYRMPVGQALSSAAEGVAFGIFPIMWIVVTAISWRLSPASELRSPSARSCSSLSASAR